MQCGIPDVYRLITIKFISPNIFRLNARIDEHVLHVFYIAGCPAPRLVFVPIKAFGTCAFLPSAAAYLTIRNRKGIAPSPPIATT
jgi:hypothetical protein